MNDQTPQTPATPNGAASALDDELERCPFCGGKAAFGKTTYSSKTIREHNWGQDTFHSVNCISCGASNRGLVGYRTHGEAAAHWNKRSNAQVTGAAPTDD